MARAGFSIEVTGVKAMTRKLKALEEMEAPEIQSALGTIAHLADREVTSRAPGSMAGRVTTKPGKKLGGSITLGVVKHPGSKAMEFGRTTYYQGYHGRNQKSGQKVKRKGQPARPYVGIKTGQQAMGALAGPVARELTEAVQKVWDRPGSD